MELCEVFISGKIMTSSSIQLLRFLYGISKQNYILCFLNGMVTFLESLYSETAFNQLKKQEGNEEKNYRGYLREREEVIDGYSL